MPLSTADTEFKNPPELIAGHIFGASGRGFARMNVAAPPSVIQETLEKLDCALRALKR
ncbi:MAG: hypothetical protein ACTTJ7_08335 [Treponema sp.]